METASRATGEVPGETSVSNVLMDARSRLAKAALML